MAVLHSGTPREEVEPYRPGDAVEVWTTAGGWRRATVVAVRAKSLDVRYFDGVDVEPVAKRRARPGR